MRVVSVANQKGGVAKTTTVLNMGAGLGILGRKVLVIDFDPQGNLTRALGMGGKFVNTIYNCLTEDVHVNDCIYETGFENLSIICSDLKLANAEIELSADTGQEFGLKEVLENIDADRFDYVLIDCCPSLGLLPVNALVASDGVIVPMETSIFSMEGIEQFVHVFLLIKRKYNRALVFDGILLTRVDVRTKDSKEFYDEVVASFRDKVFKSIIHQNIKVSQAHNARKPIFYFDANSRGGKDYMALCKEYDNNVKG